MKISLENKGIFLKLYINNVLHIGVKYADIVGLHSYIYGNEGYYINIITKDQTIELNYSTKEKWEKILELLNKAL